MDHKETIDNHIRVIINEDAWNFYITDNEDTVISEEDAAADTDFEAKEVFIREGELSLGNIKHELWHIFFGYCYLSDTTEISLNDMEEISAALFCDKGERIIERAKEILKLLLELKEKMDASKT